MSDDVAICGICLRTDRNLKEIDKWLSDLHEEILGDTSIISPESKYCCECEYLLRKMYNFKNKCVQAAVILCSRRKIEPQLRETPHFLYKLLPQNPLGVWFVGNTKIYDILCSEVDTDLKERKSDIGSDCAPKSVTYSNMPIGPILKVNIESLDILKSEEVAPEMSKSTLLEVYAPTQNPVLKINQNVNEDECKVYTPELKVCMPSINLPKTSMKHDKEEHNMNSLLLKQVSKEYIPLEQLMLNANMQVVRPMVKGIVIQKQYKDMSAKVVAEKVEMPVANTTAISMQSEDMLNFNKVIVAKNLTSLNIRNPPVTNIRNSLSFEENISEDNVHTEIDGHVYTDSSAMISNGDKIYIQHNSINIEPETSHDDIDCEITYSTTERKTLADLANIKLDGNSFGADIESDANDDAIENSNYDDIDMEEVYKKYMEIEKINSMNGTTESLNSVDKSNITKQSKDGGLFETVDNLNESDYEDLSDHEMVRENLKAIIETYGDFEIAKGVFVDREFVTTCVDSKLLSDIWELLRDQKGIVTKRITDSRYKSVFDIEYLDTDDKIVEEFRKRKRYEWYETAIHKCDVCYQTFTHAMLLKLHGRRHEENGGCFACTICGCKYDSRKALYFHHKTHRVVYRCRLCPLVTYQREAMKSHFNQHNGGVHTCTTCGTTYKSVSTYNCHLSSVHGRSHSCAVCGDAFLREDRLRWHLDRHCEDARPASGGAGVSCGECDLKFSTTEALDNHTSIVHKEDAISKPKVARENKTRVRRKRILKQEKYTSCRVCNAKGDYHFLVYHFKSEHPDADMNQLYADKKGYLCHICGKGFRACAYLQDHINKHTGRRPYACGECPRRFHGHNAAKYHRLMHAPPAHSCRLCGKVFRSRPNLYSHMLTHTRDRKYKCKICSKGFLSRAALNEHVRGVHEHQRRVRKGQNEVDNKPTKEEYNENYLIDNKEEYNENHYGVHKEEENGYYVTDEDRMDGIGHYKVTEEKEINEMNHYEVTGVDEKSHYKITEGVNETVHYEITEGVNETVHFEITEEGMNDTDEYVVTEEIVDEMDHYEVEEDKDINDINPFGTIAEEADEANQYTVQEGINEIGRYGVIKNGVDVQVMNCGVDRNGFQYSQYEEVIEVTENGCYKNSEVTETNYYEVDETDIYEEVIETDYWAAEKSEIAENWSE